MNTENEIAQSEEMCVVGSILIDEKALVNVVYTLKPEHFYFDKLKDSYKAILELSSEGKHIDFISVQKKLTAKGNYDEAQIKRLFLNCAELVPSISQIKNYAETVIDSSKARKLQQIGTRLAFDGAYAGNANEVADEVIGELYDLLSEQNKKQLQSMKDVSFQVLESYRNTDKDL